MKVLDEEQVIELCKQNNITIPTKYRSNGEKEIMHERGFTRIWDCGHMKFILNRN